MSTDLTRNSAYHIRFAELAAREAQRVLPIFERAHPDDDRPRKAIDAIKAWVAGKRTLGMAEVRRLSLDAHAAAREASSPAATYAARAAGHAVATWHAPTHAMGAPIYAGKAEVAALKESWTAKGIARGVATARPRRTTRLLSD
ncbi:MAG: putative immunity protein [Dehalococcoidia bacterium]